MAKKSVKEDSSENKLEPLIELIQSHPIIPGDSNLIVIAEYENKKVRMPINSSDFKEYLVFKYYGLYDQVPAEKNISNAIILVKQEWESKNKYPQKYRINKIEDTIRYDLYDNNISFVEITPAGYDVLENGYKYFICHSTQSPQVHPLQSDDGIDRLDKFLNLTDDQKFLYKIWLITAFNPDIVQPLAYFVGDRGTGKTNMINMLGELLDPGQIQLQNIDAVKDRDMVLGLSKGYFNSFDNVSKISRIQSDILCQAVTGGKLSYRKLYSDSDICSFDIRCRVAMSSIEDCIGSSDLAERSLFFKTEKIKPEARMTETGFSDAFKEDAPYILGSIFDILATTLRMYPKIKGKLDKARYQRLSSFSEFGYVVASIIQRKTGGNRFLDLMEQNADEQKRITDYSSDDDDPVTEYDKNLLKAVIGIMEIESEGHYESETVLFHEMIKAYAEGMPESFKSGIFDGYSRFTKAIRRISKYSRAKGLIITLCRTEKENISYIKIDRNNEGE
jgi:hypothetical protein